MGGELRGEALRAAAADNTAVARSREYALLATLLARPPDEALLKRLAII